LNAEPHVSSIVFAMGNWKAWFVNGRSAVVEQFSGHREENRGFLTRTNTRDIRLLNRCINASISTMIQPFLSLACTLLEM